MALLLFACQIAAASFCCHAQENSPGAIIWKKDRRLSITDFTRVADSASGDKISKGNLAITRTGVTYSLKKLPGHANRIEIKVFATMHPQHSFLKASALRLPESDIRYLLNHEQGHVDISEIYAREGARLLLNTSISSNYQQQVYALMQALFKQAGAWQALYDEKTRNGRDADQQKLWDQQIGDRLKSLEAYQNKTIHKQVQK